MQTSTTIDLPRFGEFSYGVDDVFEFPWGIPGFPSLHRWVALNVEEESNFIWLQSVDDVNVAIPTANPWTIFETYDPKLPAHAIAALEITDPADFTLLCVVVVGKDAEEFTMNLMAPIVLNIRNRRCRQVLLEGQGHSVRAEIPRRTDAAVSGAGASPAK